MSATTTAAAVTAADRHVAGDAPASRRRPDPVRLSLGLWGVAVLAFLYLPIVTMVVSSFNTGRVLVIWRGFGLQSYTRALADPALVASIRTSLWAAVGSSVLATVLGTTIGVGMARRGGRVSRAVLWLLMLVLVTPEIVDAVALLIWFVRLGGPFGPADTLVDYGLVRLWFGQGTYSTAVVALVVRARMASLDPAIEEAAADLYAPAARRLRQIVLPLTLPAVVAGFVLSFSLSLDNTVVSSFVSVSGSTPWSVYVFSAVRSGLRPAIAAMSTILLLLTAVSLAAVGAVLRRAGASLTGSS